MFWLKRKSHVKVIDTTVGPDGLRACDRLVWCLFQRAIESEPQCDYDALRIAHRYVRSEQVYALKHAISAMTLRAIYNDAVYAGVGIK